MQNSAQQSLGGLLIRKARWALSFRGRLLVCLVVLALALTTAKRLYPFLAITDRTLGEILVVEGWINSGSVEQAAKEYGAGQYKVVLVVAAVHDTGNKWDSGRYKPEYIAETLLRLGVPKDRLHLVLCEVVQKDRTYQSALAVQEWIRAQGTPVQGIDVVTLGPHARRSRILFQKVFGAGTNVGVIAMEERDYDPERWWRSSEGVRDVPFEALAYLYARWFFTPGK